VCKGGVAASGHVTMTTKGGRFHILWDSMKCIFVVLAKLARERPFYTVLTNA